MTAKCSSDCVSHLCKFDNRLPRYGRILSCKLAPHSCSIKQHSKACNLMTLKCNAAQHSTAQHSTAQHLKNLIQALGRERCERHLCKLVIQAGGCRFGQLIQHCQAPQQASHFHRANSLQNTTSHTSLMLSHTILTCACKSGCSKGHNWLHTPDCIVLSDT